MSTTITIDRIAKHYPAMAGSGITRAVDDVSLTIGPGQLFFLLGPSGCGKTTLLRMIAGFIEPTGGRVLFDDKNVTHRPPDKRNTGMVFQSYALWPHMTVAQNVAFGLTVRKTTAEEREQRVSEALRAVRMEQYAQRKPNQLSGGQQQRVALARALVVRPNVLLLDEPLSNLDAKLRLQMRSEIRRICKETGITTVYVTHDQKEALSMADQIAVLDMGVVAQVGTPRELYDRPATRFVADFLGETNFIQAQVRSSAGERLELDTPAGTLASTAFAREDPQIKGNVTCSIRPEAVRIVEPKGDHVLRGRIVDSMYLGEVIQHTVMLKPDGSTGGDVSDAGAIKVLQMHPAAGHPQADEAHQPEVGLAINPEDVVIVRD